MFFDSSVRSTRTIACRLPTRLQWREARRDVVLGGALAQPVDVDAERVDAEPGACGPRGSPRAAVVVVAGRAEHLDAALGERSRPARGVEPGVVAAQQAQQGLAGDLGRAAAGSTRAAPTGCA